MESLRVSWIQANLIWQDIDSNKAKFEDYLQGLEAMDVVVLPEMFTTGFSMGPHRFAQTMDGDTVSWMQHWSAQLDAAVTGSVIIENENGDFVNRLIWANPDGSLVHYDKRHLFSFANEDQHYKAGKERIIIEYKGWRIFPQVCFDLRFPVWSRNDLNYDFCFYVANWPERRSFPWKQLLLARAIENQAYVLGVNRVGEDGNGISHSGDSAMLNALGETIAQSKPFEEGVQKCTIKKSDLKEVRRKFRFLREKDQFTLHY